MSEPEEAIKAAEEAGDMFLEVVRRFWGDDLVSEVAALMASGGLLVEPQTVIMKMEDAFARAQQKEMCAAELQEVLELVNRFEPIGVRLGAASSNLSLLQTPHGSAFLAHVSAARSSLSVEVFETAIARARALSHLNFLAPLALLLERRSEPSFELSTRTVARAISDSTESWYMPLLASGLRLTYALRGDTTTNIQNEVGALVQQCRDVWTPAGGPVAMLDDRIRVLRNSEFHANTEIDVRAETVTFVNKRRDGTSERLGPWTRDEFGAFVKDFFERCLAMWLCFHIGGVATPLPSRALLP